MARLSVVPETATQMFGGLPRWRPAGHRFIHFSHTPGGMLNIRERHGMIVACLIPPSPTEEDYGNGPSHKAPE